MTVYKGKELLWVFLVSGLILVWGSIPNWAGYRAETADVRFRGLYFDSQDYAAHVAMIEAGAQGEWSYQFRFTTESFRPAYVRIFYILLGHFGRLTGLAPEATYHFARWTLGFLALYALYALMRQIFQEVFWTRVAFLLAALGSGLGWVQLIFGLTSGPITPIDFWLIDSYVFFSLSIFPHFAFVTAATCFMTSLWLTYLETSSIKRVFWIILAAILVQFTNPIALATVDAGLLGAAVFSWWRARRIDMAQAAALAVIAAAQLPLLAYNILILEHDPMWSQYTRQHQTLSPPPDYYLWGFGLFWPFAVAGALDALRARRNSTAATLFWILAAFALAYAPLYTQRRFLQNVTVPLAILATRGLIALFEMASARGPGWQRWRAGLVTLVVFFTSLSSIQISLGRSIYLQTYPENFFYPAGLDHAIAWLRENAGYNDVVLATEATSQVLAQKAGVRVYHGHEMETLAYETKKAEVLAFFQGRLPRLVERQIQWVVYGPAERELAPDFQPPDQLELMYDSDGLQIFRVK